MKLVGEFVYCAALRHRQIVRLSEAVQLEDGRFMCRTCQAAGQTPETTGAR